VKEKRETLVVGVVMERGREREGKKKMIEMVAAGCSQWRERETDVTPGPGVGGF
jgi:hypothetical protein